MKLLYAILLSLVSLFAFGDFDYDSYKIEKYEDAVFALEKSAQVDYFIESNFAKYRVAVKYAGHIREIAEEPKDLVARWVHSLQLPSEYKEQLTHEIQIEYNGIQNWLPIQQALVEPFLKEVKSDSTVELYVVAIGALKLVPVFAICEFKVKK